MAAGGRGGGGPAQPVGTTGEVAQAMARFNKAGNEAVQALLHELQAIRGQLAQQQAAIDHLVDQIRHIRQVVDQPLLDGQQGATAFEQAVTAMRATLAEHEQRLDLLSRDRTAQRLAAGSNAASADKRLTGGDYAEHQQIAGDFEGLINQDLIYLAAQVRQSQPLYDEEGIRAVFAKFLFHPEWTAQTSQELLDKARDMYPGTPVKQFLEAVRRAARIRDAAARTAHQCRWVFEHGDAFDPTWQRLAEGCHGDAPVRLVVAPAYEVDGKPYSKQIVYTSWTEPKLQAQHAQVSPQFEAVHDDAPNGPTPAGPQVAAAVPAQGAVARQPIVQSPTVQPPAAQQPTVQQPGTQEVSPRPNAFQQFGAEPDGPRYAAAGQDYVAEYYDQGGQSATGLPAGYFKHEPGSTDLFDIEAVERRAAPGDDPATGAG